MSTKAEGLAKSGVLMSAKQYYYQIIVDRKTILSWQNQTKSWQNQTELARLSWQNQKPHAAYKITSEGV